MGGNLKIFLYIGLIFLAVSCGKDKNDSLSDQPTVDSSDKIDEPLINLGNNLQDSQDNFRVDPQNFIKGVTNPYFTLVPGRKFRLAGRTPEGIDVIKELLASDRTEDILGVNTQAIWEREFRDGALVSDTKKWYAEDKEGNVWLFGQDEIEIFGGFAKGSGDSWKAGIDGARAGIVIPANPKVGDALHTEYSGYSDQKAHVVSVSESINIPQGAFSNCLKIRDYQDEKGKPEDSFYCKDVGNLSLESIPGTFGKIQLTDVEDHFSTSGMNIHYPEFKVSIDEAKAKELALDAVDGAKSVANLTIKLWENKPAYAIEVLKEEDKKVMVYLNVQNGSIVKVID